MLHDGYLAPDILNVIFGAGEQEGGSLIVTASQQLEKPTSVITRAGVSRWLTETIRGTRKDS
jgi:hypothetical protein